MSLLPTDGASPPSSPLPSPASRSSSVSDASPRRVWMSVALGFFLCGIFNNITYVVMLSAAKDILQGSLVSYVLLADDMPALVAQFMSPFFPGFTFRARVMTVAVLNVVALAIVSSVAAPELRLLGVVVASLAFGLGESTFFSLLAHFDVTAISGFSSGTGGAGMLGAGLYYVLTDVLFLSWQNALRMVAAMIPIYAFSYNLLIAPNRWKFDAVQAGKGKKSDGSTGGGGGGGGGGSGGGSGMGGGGGGSMGSGEDSGGIRGQVAKIRRSGVFWYFLPLFVMYIITFATNHAVLPHLHGPHKGNYVLFFFAYQVAVFVSRSSLKVLQLHRRLHLWLLVFGQFLCFAALLLLALDELEMSMDPAVVVAFMGLLSGSAYVNTFNLIRTNTAAQYREFAMGFASVATTAGPVVAALSGMLLERYIVGLVEGLEAGAEGGEGAGAGAAAGAAAAGAGAGAGVAGGGAQQ